MIRPSHPSLSWMMLAHYKARLILTIGGVGVAFFLAQAQFGLLVGWVDTCTAIMRHAKVDLWVVAPKAPAFDYGTAIPRHRIDQARSVSGVSWAQGMFIAWNIWQRSDGRRVNIQLVGLDKDTVGGPWIMKEGTVEAVLQPNTVIVDELYASALGFERLGQDFEMIGKHARIGGISRGVRTLSACPFVFTSITEAIRYDQRYRSEEITYVLVRCEKGADVSTVQNEMRRQMPNVEVLTTQEFALRTGLYWMLETGVGFTVIVTAILGLGVGVVIMSQTLYAITQDHLPNYATLLGLGFRRTSLVRIVLVQSLALGGLGIVGGSALFFPVAWLSERTPIPLEMTPTVFAGLVVVSLLSCFVASMMSVRSIFNIDLVGVFRA